MISVPAYSTFDHYGTLATCALCGSASALKLVGDVFWCEWCIRVEDWLGVQR